MHIRARQHHRRRRCRYTPARNIIHWKWYCKRETISCVFCVSCRVQFSLVHLCCGWTFYSHHFSCRPIRSISNSQIVAQQRWPESTFGLHTNWLSARSWRRFMPTTFTQISLSMSRTPNVAGYVLLLLLCPDSMRSSTTPHTHSFAHWRQSRLRHIWIYICFAKSSYYNLSNFILYCNRWKHAHVPTVSIHSPSTLLHYPPTFAFSQRMYEKSYSGFASFS